MINLATVLIIFLIGSLSINCSSIKDSLPSSSNAPLPKEVLTNKAEFDTIVLRADIAMEQQEWDKALGLYAEALIISPSHINLKLKRAICYERGGKIQQAATLYEELINEKDIDSRIVKTAEINLRRLNIDANLKNQQAEKKADPVPSKVLVHQQRKNTAKISESPKAEILVHTMKKSVIPAEQQENSLKNVELPTVANSIYKHDANENNNLIEKANFARGEISSETKKQLITTITNWRDAWSNKNLSGYYELYADNFSGDEKSPALWRSSRKALFATSAPSRLSIKDVRFNRIDDKTISADMRQLSYRADKLIGEGKKILVFKQAERKWLIVQEISVKN